MASYLDEISDGIALNDTPVETISQSGVIDGSTERFRVKYEFDVNDPSAYSAAWTAYPSAWNVYLGVTGKTFGNTPFDGTSSVEGESLANPVVLQQAINFYIYTAGADTLFDEAQQEILVTAVAASDGRIRSLENYIKETGSGNGTYENPNAFYDTDVYERVANASDFLPRVTLNGDQTISQKTDSGRDVDFSQIFSSDQLTSTEYETTRNGPSGFYDWGSSYATGKKTY